MNPELHVDETQVGQKKNEGLADLRDWQGSATLSCGDRVYHLAVQNWYRQIKHATHCNQRQVRHDTQLQL